MRQWLQKIKPHGNSLPTLLVGETWVLAGPLPSLQISTCSVDTVSAENTNTSCKRKSLETQSELISLGHPAYDQQTRSLNKHRWVQVLSFFPWKMLVAQTPQSLPTVAAHALYFQVTSSAVANKCMKTRIHLFSSKIFHFNPNFIE